MMRCNHIERGIGRCKVKSSNNYNVQPTHWKEGYCKKHYCELKNIPYLINNERKNFIYWEECQNCGLKLYTPRYLTMGYCTDKCRLILIRKERKAKREALAN